MDKKYKISEDNDALLASEAYTTWGGPWTERKLIAFEKYVNAYLTIMNAYRDKNEWKLIYFDGFAGSGSRNENEDVEILYDEDTLKIFNELEIKEEELTPYKGAAERVLNTTLNGFDYYYFIDKDETSSNQLKEKLSRIQTDKELVFRHSDANEQLELLADAMHKNTKLKSLVLLDPFGMQVNWNSISKLEGTGTDLWILIPTGVIVNRLLDRKCKLTHIEKLTSFFGKDETFLKNYFYNTRYENTLFGETEIVEKVKNPIEKIANLYIQQMQTIFKYVTEMPLVLYNTRNIPIFHFAFASNNQSAVKIAHQIINK
ncbi:MAG: three-Cys-motif partner protein TcmP [Bacteroidales bacterium]|nr:three-Cys-motif partner protein TcmP [Bacteroidales bacterium]